MAARVLFFIVTVLFVLQTEAASYRRGFFKSTNSFIQPMMDEAPDDFITRRALLAREVCKDDDVIYCERWQSHCLQPGYFSSQASYAMFSHELCPKKCGNC